MGDVTLTDFLTSHDLLPDSETTPDIYLGTPTEADRDTANLIAETLRASKLRVFVNITKKSLGDQIKDADRRGIPYFAATGEDERASKTLRIKKLSSGEEHPLALTDVASFIRS
jgi:histidyl-tRNA synthetase